MGSNVSLLNVRVGASPNAIVVTKQSTDNEHLDPFNSNSLKATTFSDWAQIKRAIFIQ